MRITHLRFANLNALEGEWTIDFENPAFLDDGIFAITGPTGSGKTTILDAICLALYGSTPRLGRMTANQNEIMSRRQGECFAEVYFETANGRYSCFWGQHKSRQQADGNLQPAKHELSDLETGKVLATKLKVVEKKVEALTGMDFEQFTRSMLLAQGSFAAFLQASPSERSPILEKITGTGIYTEISKAVFERYKALKGELADLQKALDYTPLLSADEAERLQAEHAQGVVQCQALELEAQSQGRWLQVDQERTETLQRQQVLTDAEAQWQQAAEAFAPQAAALAADQRTAPLREVFYELRTLRQQQEDLQLQAEQLQAQYPAATEALTVAAETLEALNQRCEAKESDAEAAQVEWKAMAELDHSLRQAHDRLQELQQRWQLEQTHLTPLAAQRTACQSEIETLSETRVQLQEQTLARATQGELVESLGRLQDRFEALNADHDHWSQLQQHMESLRAEQAQRSTTSAQLEQDLQAAQGTLAAQQERLATDRQALADYPVASVLQARREAMTEQRVTLEQAQQQVGQAQALRQRLATHQAQWQAGQDQAEAEAKDLAARQSEWAALQKQREEWAYRLRLEERIINLEAYRQDLHSGDPCPLCGATEHPFREGNADGEVDQLDQVDQVDQAFSPDTIQPETTRDRLQALEAELAELQQAIHTGQTAQELWASQSETLQHTIQETRQQWEDLIRALPDAPGETEAELTTYAADLTARLAALTGELVEIKAQQSQRETLDAQVQQGLARQQELADAVTAARQALEQFRQGAEAQERDLEQSSQQAQTLRAQMQGHLEVLTAACARYAASDQAPTELTELTELPAGEGLSPAQWASLTEGMDTLAELRKTWLALQEQLQQTRQALELAQQRQTSLETQWAQAQERAEQAHVDYQAAIAEHAHLQTQRQDIFGARDAEAEAQSVRAELTSLRAQQQTAVQVHQQARDRHMQLAQQNQEQARQTAVVQNRLTTVQDTFAEGLSQQDFDHEAAFAAAILPAETRQALQEQAQQLERQHTQYQAEQAALGARLNQLQLPAGFDREAVTLAHQNTQQALHEALQQQGAIQSQLKQHQQAQQAQKEHLQQLQAVQRDYEHWKVMYDLIGSSDGKRYRDFAQGLTFDVVLSHANVQLQKMSGRYLLVRSNTYALDLSVMDQQQGGEIRSAQNLSGGESFIVSMALALGLSQMASNNVQVDSLFLDEGFGTLDEEALDVALNTLAELHQENKLIGVISHVPSLKERITTQIKVHPISGGVSRLEGPGCQGVR